MLQLQLIALYDYVCRCYTTYPALHYQRQSNNHCPAFTDQELMTIYLFGLLEQRFTLRLTYDYITDHWADWFPQLPSYQAVNHRLNQLGWQFEILATDLTQRLQAMPHQAHMSVTDSLPIILSQRPFQAKVAPQVADKGYCSTKKLYYHGLKLHLVSFSRPGTLPLPERLQFTPASAHDLTSLRTHLPCLIERTLLGDKIYANGPLEEVLWTHQRLSLLTPIKLKKGQKRLDAADKLFSRAVSRVRQPIESFFNWLIDHTGIQRGARVRSEKGLLLHCFGRLAAGLYLMLFNS